MAKKRIKRPRDPVELAKLVGDIATGQVEDARIEFRFPRASGRDLWPKNALKGV